jgi:Tol biopolymer transport system component
MRKIIISILVLFISTLLAFAQENKTDKSDFPILTGPYLGQKPPGMIPEIFAPGLVSTKDHLEFGCTWSPDGKEFYFTRRGGEYLYNTLIVCRWNDSLWTEPEVVTFSDPYPKMNPRFFPGGSKLVYTAWRPPKQDAKESSPFSLWITEKSNGKWNDPESFQPWFSMSVSNDGTIYFHSDSGIGIAKEENGNYQETDILGNKINTGNFDQHPYVSSNGSYFVFDSHRPGGYGDADLYVAFRDKKNAWQIVLNLGEYINNDKPNFSPVLSPDGKYLFYTNDEDIYWVSTQIIEELKREK